VYIVRVPVFLDDLSSYDIQKLLHLGYCIRLDKDLDPVSCRGLWISEAYPYAG
jgi:hypothetical protein